MIEVQSLSVCVPGGCPNACKFCVSQMHTSPYVNQIEKNLRFRDLYEKDYLRRLHFARDNGCNTVILTGDGEPLLNRSFLKDFAHWNNAISSPFRWVELQTSGVTLDDEALRFLRNTVGISTISLSLSDLFSDDSNQAMNGTPDKLKVCLVHLCSEIKKYDFNLRLSLNMTDVYEKRFLGASNDSICQEILNRANQFGADQVTFRRLYVSGNPIIEQNKWIAAHAASDNLLIGINMYIRAEGRALETLPFGAVRYSVDGLSVVMDGDCMSTEVKPTMKYLVLRPNCKLYTKWDDTGSLLF
jgi:hypothetical protein